MVFGLSVTIQTLVPGGLLLLVLLIFQVLTGKRIITFKGRRHLQVHTWTAYLMGLVALYHGFLGLVLALNIEF